jgi:UDP-glucuronate decarboxylase
LPSDDPVRRRPDIDLARSMLEWEPQIGLAEGLQKTIAYFRQLQHEVENTNFVAAAVSAQPGTQFACR